MAQLHDCSAGLKRRAHLPDACTGGRTEGDIARKGCGYMMTALLAWTEKIAGDNCTTAQQAGRKVRCYTITTLPTGIYRDNCAAGRKRGSQLHDNGTAGRNRQG